MFGVLLYMTVVIPGLRTVCVPIEGETRDVQIEALRVLAAGNTLIAGCLGLVLALQVRGLSSRFAERTSHIL
jgi:ER membrane protein SH3